MMMTTPPLTPAATPPRRRDPRSARVRLAVLVAATALAAAACSSPTADLDPIRADLQTQARAQAALVDRIAELEGLLDTLTSSQGGSLVELTDALESRSAELEATLVELEATLAELQAQLAAELTAREDGDAVNSAALSNLDARISALKTTLEAVQRDLKKLTSSHDLLRAEFETHVRNHG